MTEIVNLEDLMKEIMQGGKEEPLVKKEIKESDYIDSALSQAQEYMEKYNRICGMVQELYRKIARGNIIKYYKTTEGLHYEVKEKRRAGF